MMRLFDTHAHLDQEEFAADMEATLERAHAAGVEGVLCVGVSAASSEAVVHLAEKFSRVYAAVGIHPNSTAEIADGDWDRIVALADHPKTVALGETGLDRYWDYAPIDLQRDYFGRHLKLSRERSLPVVIHCRDAVDDCMAMLREEAQNGPIKGILHAFSGDAAMAEECLQFGLLISFAGNVTYRNKKFEPMREAAKIVPLERLLIETDSPYLTPEPLRGKEKRNEPAQTAHTARFLADLRGVSLETLAERTTENARALLGLV